MLKLEAAHSGFRRSLRSFADHDALSAELHRRFRYIGDEGVRWFLSTVVVEVPPYDRCAIQHGLSAGTGAHTEPIDWPRRFIRTVPTVED
jgi:hypothetical protein